MSVLMPPTRWADVPSLLTRPGELRARLDAFAQACSTLSRLTLAAPSETALDAARDEQVLSRWPFADPESARGVALLAESRIAREAAPTVRADHTRLFAAPDRMVAPPFESAYRCAESSLGVRPASMRAAECGLAGPGRHEVPEDHIGRQLEFLAALCGQAMAAHDAGDDRALARLLDGAGRLLDEHLLAFGPLVMHRAADGARTYFYQGVAAMALGCLGQAEAAFRRP